MHSSVRMFRPSKVLVLFILYGVAYIDTINADEDILLIDAIRRHLIGEISWLHDKKAHKWYYLKDGSQWSSSRELEVDISLTTYFQLSNHQRKSVHTASKEKSRISSR